MKKELIVVLALLFVLFMLTGVQAQNQDPVGLTPTPEDAHEVLSNDPLQPPLEPVFSHSVSPRGSI